MGPRVLALLEPGAPISGRLRRIHPNLSLIEFGLGAASRLHNYFTILDVNTES